VSWIWNIKLRLFIGGPILIVLRVILYLVKSASAVFALPIVGVVLIIARLFYKPVRRQ
jgi:hypothetical protein